MKRKTIEARRNRRHAKAGSYFERKKEQLAGHFRPTSVFQLSESEIGMDIARFKDRKKGIRKRR